MNAILYVLMTIADIQERGKQLLGRIPSHVATVAILVLSTTGAFGLGILAGRDLERAEGAGKGFWIENMASSSSQAAAVSTGLPRAPVSKALSTPPSSGGFVASKNGTKYYLPSCGGAGRMKEENKVWFTTKEDAEASGYTPASNCPGL